MSIFAALRTLGHEQLILCRDPAAGYEGIIAVHSTVLGPAVGGTRFRPYASEEEAVRDALRLARGMTYKCAAAGLPLGGGKSVIIGDPGAPGREARLRAHARFVDRLGGRYLTAEDVGTTPADMLIMREETPHVAGLPGRSGNPSPVTALGVFRAMQAAARWRWGSDDLSGRTVALQGCGSVGAALARRLHEAGAALVVSDVVEERAAALAAELGGRTVAPAEIHRQPADIFAPCALGAVLTDATIPELRVEIVAGAANNQLLEPRHGDLLEERGILYVPDYIANAGGVINGSREVLGWSEETAAARVRELYDATLRVFELARAQRVPPHVAADRMAEERLAAGAGEIGQ